MHVELGLADLGERNRERHAEKLVKAEIKANLKAERKALMQTSHSNDDGRLPRADKGKGRAREEDGGRDHRDHRREDRGVARYRDERDEPSRRTEEYRRERRERTRTRSRSPDRRGSVRRRVDKYVFFLNVD